MSSRRVFLHYEHLESVLLSIRQWPEPRHDIVCKDSDYASFLYLNVLQLWAQDRVRLTVPHRPRFIPKHRAVSISSSQSSEMQFRSTIGKMWKKFTPLVLPVITADCLQHSHLSWSSSVLLSVPFPPSFEKTLLFSLVRNQLCFYKKKINLSGACLTCNMYLISWFLSPRDWLSMCRWTECIG